MRSLFRFPFLLLAVLAAALLPATAWPHTTQLSAARLVLKGAEASAQMELNGRDLEVALKATLLDAAGQVAPDALRAGESVIAAYLREHVQLVEGDAPCEAGVTGLAASGDHVRAALAWRCPASGGALRYRATLFLEIDPRARHMITVEGDTKRFGLLAAGNETLEILAAPESPWSVAGRYLLAGIEHIAIGFDHIAFLVATVVWGRRFWPLAKVITAFTLAHSITLTLATLGVVALPTALVESTIAASVVAAALNNIWPLFQGRRWLVAFGFGLIHGFGFASVLADLGLPGDALLLALVGFNLGVEAGQLAIVVVFVPVAFVLRARRFYNPGLLKLGSAAIALLALVWLWERAAPLLGNA